MTNLSVLLRLAVLPALAAAVVLLVATVSFRDLKKPKPLAPPPAVGPETLETLKHPLRTSTIPRSTSGPMLSEEDALRRLRKGPARAAIDRLWPLRRHRDRLFAALLEPHTEEEDRLYLLGRFEREDPTTAIEAARAILQEQELPSGPLLPAVYEILSRYGDSGDLPLLVERSVEEPEVKVVREACREALRSRARPRT